jgi:hypothetical protein
MSVRSGAAGASILGAGALGGHFGVWRIAELAALALLGIFLVGEAIAAGSGASMFSGVAQRVQRLRERIRF